MTLSRRASTGLLLVIFAVSFFLRAYRPLSRPEQWLQRSDRLSEAYETGDWSLTARGSSHTGFTAVFVSGTALQLYDALKGTGGEAIFSWAVVPYATESGRRMAAGVLGLAMVISLLIVAITLTLRRLGGWPLGVSAGGLLVFSPFFLTQSRALHVDALVSSLMLLSATLLLLYLEDGRQRYFVLSSLMGGLALLTKVPSIFLIPFTGLALLVYTMKAVRGAWRDHTDNRFAWLAGTVWRGLMRPLLLWIVLAALPFALWPAMWAVPGEVFGSIFSRTSDHFSLGHDRRFFAGQVINWDHPPVTFYPLTLAFVVSFATMTLFAGALGQYGFWHKRMALPVKPTTFWLMLAYVVFFTIQMTIGASQVSRYILPAYVMVEVLAAIGLVGLLRVIEQAVEDRGRALPRWLPGVLVGGVIALQAVIVLPYAPNYGAHHNHLLGGNRVAVNVIEIAEHTEGIPQAAAFLNRQPNSGALQVGIARPLPSIMQQYFSGEVVTDLSAADDFHIFTVRHIQRQHNTDDWLHAWEFYGESQPQLMVIFDGVPYLWLYDTQPPDPYQPVEIRRGGGVGFTVLAWVWTAVVVGTLAIGLKREPSGEQLVGGRREAIPAPASHGSVD